MQELDFIEHFSGHEVLASEASEAGLQVGSLDILHSPRGMDILKPSGYGSLGQDFVLCLS